MIKKRQKMSRKHPQGVDGVSTPDENEHYPLPPQDPPKIQTKEEEKMEKPNFIVRLYERITKRNAL